MITPLDWVLPVLPLQSLGAADDGEDQPAETHERQQPAEEVKTVIPPKMATSTNAIEEINWKLNDLAASLRAYVPGVDSA